MTDSDQLTDEELLAAVNRNDPGAFELFVRRYGQRVLAFGQRMCGHREDAEDVYQDTMLTAYQGLRDLREPRAVRTWLFRVAANACLMRRRREARAREVPLAEVGSAWDEEQVPEIPDWSEIPEGAAARAELREALEASVRQLPRDNRLVLLLRDVEGLSTRETAEALDIGVPAVKMRLHRARGAMRDLLRQRASGGVAAE